MIGGSSMNGGAVIVGAGQAGLQLAVDLRQRGYDGEVTLIGEEAHAPYQRPPLSKKYLVGAFSRDALMLRKPEFYRTRGIDLVTGARVTSVLPDPGGGGTVELGDGRSLAYRDLALATGARARRIPIPGGDAPNVLVMRSMDDADQLRARLADVKQVVVIGGGFIGLESAAVMRSLGTHVVLVEAVDRLLARVAAPELGRFYLDAHTRRGVDVRLGTGVSAIETDESGNARAVVLADGESIPADVVIVGIGVVRDPHLAEQVGARWDGGIVVDERARTTAPGVVAAGDCAVWRNPLSPSDRPSCVESVQNAVDQAKVAAATMCGDESAVYDSVPWFWSDQDDLKLQMAGLCQGSDQRVLRGDPGSEGFSILHFKNGRFIAIDSVNRSADFMAARKALPVGATITDLDAAADVARPLKELFA
ncbi:MAG: NAD(P)/FAD-dependent oxidoreductase [Dietzia sp.]